MTVAAWVLSGYFSFVSEFKDTHVEITHDSESGVNVNVIGCVSLCVSSVLCWRPAQGVPCFSTNDRWDRFQFSSPEVIMDAKMWISLKQNRKKFELQLVRTSKEQSGAIQDMPKKTLKVGSDKFESEKVFDFLNTPHMTHIVNSSSFGSKTKQVPTDFHVRKHYLHLFRL